MADNGFFKELFDVLYDENDVICIVVSTSYIDHALTALLESQFIKSSVTDSLLGEDGLGLKRKGDLAYCLGMITTQDMQNIEIIGKIRNRIAHRINGLTFTDRFIRERCSKLRHRLLADATALDLAFPDRRNAPDDPKTQFIFVSYMLCATMAMSAARTTRCVKLKDAP